MADSTAGIGVVAGSRARIRTVAGSWARIRTVAGSSAGRRTVAGSSEAMALSMTVAGSRAGRAAGSGVGRTGSRVSVAGLPDHRVNGAVSSPFIRKASASRTEPSPIVTP